MRKSAVMSPNLGCFRKMEPAKQTPLLICLSYFCSGHHSLHFLSTSTPPTLLPTASYLNILLSRFPHFDFITVNYHYFDSAVQLCLGLCVQGFFLFCFYDCPVCCDFHLYVASVHPFRKLLALLDLMKFLFLKHII